MDAWIQCASGASGDMLLGALLDAGASLPRVRAEIEAVGVGGIEVRTERVHKAGLTALKAHVVVAESHHHRRWADIRGVLDTGDLTASVRDRAVEVFTRLAEAEGRVHGIAADEVHFHEVGALDAIADVVGVCAAVEDLDLRTVCVSPVAVGSGTVRAAHGRLPVPVPAVIELLAAVEAPVLAGPAERELCTPTGAALLTTLAHRWGPLPAMRITGTGVGAGTAELPDTANVVRVVLGLMECAAGVA